jgi:hypothetical protein
MAAVIAPVEFRTKSIGVAFVGHPDEGLFLDLLSALLADVRAPLFVFPRPSASASALPISSARMRAGSWSSRVDLPLSCWLRTGRCSHSSERSASSGAPLNSLMKEKWPR